MLTSRRTRTRIAHVQLADTPGRGEPGSGDTDFPAVVSALLDKGYTGAYALEYIPATTTEQSVAAWRRAVETWPTLDPQQHERK